MFFSDILGGRSLLRDRIDSIVHQPRATVSGYSEERSFAPRSRRLSCEDHLYFAIRPFATSGARNVLQYAFVDDRGNVVMTAMGLMAGPPFHSVYTPPGDLAVDPVDPEALEYLLTRLCSGATLVCFGRVLQAGLLPWQAVNGSASVECAWRRFMQLARRRGIRLERNQPVTLDDALRLAGLPPLASQDAALRALGIRDLWSWMEGVE